MGAASGNNATVDFYFLNAIGEFVSNCESISAEHPIGRLGPNTFATHDRLVIVRYINPDEAAAVRVRRWKRVYYVIDDALHDAERSTDLPADYRRRLRTFIREGLPRILELEPHILAPSAHILDAYPGLPGNLIDPCRAHFGNPDSDLAHHDRHGPLTLCFLGTRSHKASLELLQSIAEALPAIAPDSRLTIFFGDYLPRAMRRLANIDNRPPLPWPEFKCFLDTHRFHVCLAPLLPTPFNRGRSITKILDSASVGAAALYSPRSPFSNVVSEGHDGLLVDDDPQAWIAQLALLARDREKCRSIAGNGILLANLKGNRERLRRFWFETLDLEETRRPTI